MLLFGLAGFLREVPVKGGCCVGVGQLCFLADCAHFVEVGRSGFAGVLRAFPRGFLLRRFIALP